MKNKKQGQRSFNSLKEVAEHIDVKERKKDKICEICGEKERLFFFKGKVICGECLRADCDKNDELYYNPVDNLTTGNSNLAECELFLNDSQVWLNAEETKKIEAGYNKLKIKYGYELNQRRKKHEHKIKG